MQAPAPQHQTWDSISAQTQSTPTKICLNFFLLIIGRIRCDFFRFNRIPLSPDFESEQTLDAVVIGGYIVDPVDQMTYFLKFVICKLLILYNNRLLAYPIWENGSVLKIMDVTLQQTHFIRVCYILILCRILLFYRSIANLHCLAWMQNW